ncbi:MAG TPA: PilZ domain-containing protein [Phycisphaerae bacterium]|nr:PilZ domain-containing protein [Phycisphaerae bacterium]
MQQERRQSCRLQLRLPISGLSVAGESAGAEGLWTRNISAGGMLFEMPVGSAPECAHEMSFELSVPPGEGYAASESKLRGTGRVVRTVPAWRGNVAVAVHFSQPLAMSLGA